MKIGLHMLLWTARVTAEHEPLLADIKATGYDGVEIPIFGGRPERYAELGALLDRIGLERTAMTSLGDASLNLISADAAARQAGVDYLKRAVDCAQALGATLLAGPLHSTMGLLSGRGPTAEERQRSVDAQRAIGDHAAGRGVTIGLEVLNRFECYFLNTMADLSAHVDEIGHPNIRAMYDTFHAHIEERDPAAAFADNARNIVHVHLSENDRGELGRGHFAWDRLFAELRQRGYDGWLTVEAFGRANRDLAAATKVWRDLIDSEQSAYRRGFEFVRDGWARAAPRRETRVA